MSFKEIKYPKAIKELEQFFKDVQVHAGFFDGKPHGDGETIASIAAENELTRPFMSRAIDDAENEIHTFIKNEMSKEGYNRQKTFKKVGLKLKALITKQIQTSRTWAIPNAPATVARKTRSGKQGDHPLIDTGIMVADIDFKINGKKV